MRGYLSFLLVLSILLCIFAFLSPLKELHATSYSRAIEAERTNSISMNAKEALVLSTSYWMRTSAFLYDLLPEDAQIPAERELAIKAGILSGWVLLSSHNFSDDFEIEFWCGQINRNTNGALSKDMLDSRGVLLCEGCVPLSSPTCTNYIHLEQKAPHGTRTIDRIQLKGSPLSSQSVSFPHPTFGYFGAIGASIYSPKFNTSNVVYFPVTEWIE